MDDRGVISARNTISSLQSLLPALRDAQGSKHINTNIGSVFQRGKMIKMAADIGLAQSSNGHHWSKALRLKLHSNKVRRRSLRLLRRKSMASVRRRTVRPLRKERKMIKIEKDGVERRLKALKRLVPGGRTMDLERLFDETSDYIMALRGQVMAMKALASFFESKNAQKRAEKNLQQRDPC